MLLLDHVLLNNARKSLQQKEPGDKMGFHVDPGSVVVVAAAKKQNDWVVRASAAASVIAAA